MTQSQLAALCRGIERQDVIEVTSHTGARHCGVPERVRIDLSGERPLVEVVIRTSGRITEAVCLSDVWAVRFLSKLDEV